MTNVSAKKPNLKKIPLEYYRKKDFVNLIMKDKPKSKPSQITVVGLLLAVLVVAFTKFAVIDRLAAASKATNDAEKAEQKLERVKQETVDYDTILEEYNRYFLTIGMIDDTLIDRSEIVRIIETRIMQVSTVSSFNVSENTATLQIGGLTFEEAAVLYQALLAEPEVESVIIPNTNAADDTGIITNASMTIHFVKQ